ncbi:unnamed protein product [marine sediment metagenome]|uniref:Uncharacterized protein n=1 Tax=marine sediment metagenome TaxID=412755 RepID=X0WDQ3_9ZZZZ
MSRLDDILKEAGVGGREPTAEEVRIARLSISSFVAKAITEVQQDEGWDNVPDDSKKTLLSFADTVMELARTAPDETMASLTESCLKVIAYQDAMGEDPKR